MLHLSSVRWLDYSKVSKIMPKNVKIIKVLKMNPIFIFTERSFIKIKDNSCLLYTSPSPRDQRGSRMPSSA